MSSPPDEGASSSRKLRALFLAAVGCGTIGVAASFATVVLHEREKAAWAPLYEQQRAEVARLRAQEAALRHQLDELASRDTGLGAEVERLRKNRDALEKTIQALEAAATEAGKSLAATRERHAALDRESNGLAARIDALNKEIEERQAEKDRQTTEAEAAGLHRDEAEKAARDLRGEIAALQEKKGQLEDAVAHAQSSAASLDATARATEQASAELARQRQREAELTAHADALAAQVSRLEAQAASLSDVEQTLSQRRQEMEALTAELQSRQAATAKAREEHDALLNGIAELERHRSSLAIAIQAGEEHLHALEEENGRRKADSDQIGAQLDLLRPQYDWLNGEVARLEAVRQQTIRLVAREKARLVASHKQHPQAERGQDAALPDGPGSSVSPPGPAPLPGSTPLPPPPKP